MFSIRQNTGVMDDLTQKGTNFQKMVWTELKKIPFGETRTYKEIAVAIGKPKAARAVANACGKNPYPIIIILRHLQKA